MAQATSVSVMRASRDPDAMYESRIHLLPSRDCSRCIRTLYIVCIKIKIKIIIMLQCQLVISIQVKMVYNKIIITIFTRS